MVLIGLLLVALACLVLGLVLASGIWLIASLVASALAGYVLWRKREQIAGQSGVHKDEAAPKTAPRQTELVTGKAFTAQVDPTSAQASNDGPSAAVGTDSEVWVVDGRPQFHRRDCAQISDAEVEPIPFAQASEDGFIECSACTPVARTGPGNGHGEPVGTVWVVDGRPDYHDDSCRTLRTAAAQSESEAEQIPHVQAVEDGFSPCPDCSPAAANGAAAMPARTDQVWVVDGRPRYHLESCLIIKDQPAEQIPLAQATEDGFMACTMCAPQH
jgi:hypothetical protein